MGCPTHDFQSHKASPWGIRGSRSYCQLPLPSHLAEPRPVLSVQARFPCREEERLTHKDANVGEGVLRSSLDDGGRARGARQGQQSVQLLAVFAAGEAVGPVQEGGDLGGHVGGHAQQLAAAYGLGVGDERFDTQLQARNCQSSARLRAQHFADQSFATAGDTLTDLPGTRRPARRY